MFRLKNIMVLVLSGVATLAAQFADAQFVTQVVGYLPAPGQYTNADHIGTPEAAQSLVGTNKGMLSLGGFGGSVVVYFPDGIKNDSQNPYGVDFTVYGNATSTWSEPGIIEVMKDENHNGIPDETWYEIAGSDHFWNSTKSAYQVTYQNSGATQATDIAWTDNLGAQGIIPENSFHQQPYYPKSDLFPGISADSYTLSGTRIQGQIDLSVPGQVIARHRAFGYADNTPVLSWTEKLPDNPYTEVVEGSGGDAIDISWAVDANKNPVNLDEIHFIRIYTGMNALAGWLGEISTEITGIRDVEPAVVAGPQSAVVIEDLPAQMGVGQKNDVNAILFDHGIPNRSAEIDWSVNNTNLAVVQNGQLVAKGAGTIVLRAFSVADPGLYSEKQIGIYSVGKAQITNTITSLKVNDKLHLSGKITNQNGETITGINPVWSVENEQIAEIISVDGIFYVRGIQPGETRVFLEAENNPSIRDSVLITVFPESELKKVFIAVKTEEKTIIPRHPVWVSQFDLTSKVDRAQKTYGLQDIGFVSLAHAIAATFNETELSSDWAFRDDAEGNSQLYLWRVPESDEGSVIYTFGYGGSRSSDAYRKTWMVMLNQQTVASGFDQLKINNGDEILIYHIPDNNLSWEVTQLTLSDDTININQNIEAQFKKYSCSMNENREVSVLSSDAIGNGQVKMTSVLSASPVQTSLTDEFGKAAFTVSESGNFQVTAGIDIATLVSESETAAHFPATGQQSLVVYPNPFDGQLQISSQLPIDAVEIFNVQGQVIRTYKNPGYLLDTSALTSGLYLVRVKSGSQIFVRKAVKN